MKKVNALALGLTFAVSLGLLAQQSVQKKADTYGRAFQILVSPALDTGEPTDAPAYYKDIVTKDTGFKTDPRPALGELLRYFGFSLTGEEL